MCGEQVQFFQSCLAACLLSHLPASLPTFCRSLLFPFLSFPFLSFTPHSPLHCLFLSASTCLLVRPPAFLPTCLLIRSPACLCSHLFLPNRPSLNLKSLCLPVPLCLPDCPPSCLFWEITAMFQEKADPTDPTLELSPREESSMIGLQTLMHRRGVVCLSNLE
jgi:hypothetical protein